MFASANTILYCRHWHRTVEFYRVQLALPVLFANDWFVEFRLTDTARLSVADQSRARIKSSGGQGITLALQVEAIETVRQALQRQGVEPGPVEHHPWGARVCYLCDPEGHRIELWEPDR